MCQSSGRQKHGVVLDDASEEPLACRDGVLGRDQAVGLGDGAVRRLADPVEAAVTFDTRLDLPAVSGPGARLETWFASGVANRSRISNRAFGVPSL